VHLKYIIVLMYIGFCYDAMLMLLHEAAKIFIKYFNSLCLNELHSGLNTF